MAKDEKYILTLYVTGKTASTGRALRNLNSICEKEIKAHFELRVIDVLDRPQLAEDEKILATPTLIRELPPPIRRIVGDLSDKEQVLVGLDLITRHSKIE